MISCGDFIQKTCHALVPEPAQPWAVRFAKSREGSAAICEANVANARAAYTTRIIRAIPIHTGASRDVAGARVNLTLDVEMAREFKSDFRFK